MVCVYDTVCKEYVPIDEVDELPGETYSLSEQCKLFVHPTAEPCVSVI